MVLLFYVDKCLIFSPSKYKIDEVYAYIQAYFKIEDDGELNNYHRIFLECRPDGSIHIAQPYLTQIILNIIPGMDNSSAKTTPVVKPPLAKNERAQASKNDFNYRSVIGSLNFLTNLARPKAQFVVNQCAQFGANPKLPHDQEVKRVLEYLNFMATQIKL